SSRSSEPSAARRSGRGRARLAGGHPLRLLAAAAVQHPELLLGTHRAVYVADEDVDAGHPSAVADGRREVMLVIGLLARTVDLQDQAQGRAAAEQPLELVIELGRAGQHDLTERPPEGVVDREAVRGG